MEKNYPIGTVVRLKNGEAGIMITSVLPLYNHMGQVGYFDYSACLYPYGQTDQNSFFFNEEDIEEVLFEGYKDDKLYPKLEEMIKTQLQTVKYPHYSLELIQKSGRLMY
jgi:hypothetical protein